MSYEFCFWFNEDMVGYGLVNKLLQIWYENCYIIDGFYFFG